MDSTADPTVHLLVSATPESASRQLEWDNYCVFDYQTYIICRSADASAFVLEKGDLKKGLYFIELKGPKSFRGKLTVD